MKLIIIAGIEIHSWKCVLKKIRLRGISFLEQTDITEILSRNETKFRLTWRRLHGIYFSIFRNACKNGIVLSYITVAITVIFEGDIRDFYRFWQKSLFCHSFPCEDVKFTTLNGMCYYFSLECRDSKFWQFSLLSGVLPFVR